MLIRFIAKNLFSFDEETEFNVFPNKTQRLPHHKVKKNGIDILRLTAIYGANGAGKSNLIRSIWLLKLMIQESKVIDNFDDIKFKLSERNLQSPISVAIEFYHLSKIYYYTLTFDEGVILNEALYESKEDQDILIFERNIENNKQRIVFFGAYIKNEKNRLFVEVLAEKILQKNELLLSFLNAKYQTEFIDVSNVCHWFDKNLIILYPNSKPSGLPQEIDKNNDFKSFINNFISTLNVGISNISIAKGRLNDFLDSAGIIGEIPIIDEKVIREFIDNIKKNPNQILNVENSKTGDEVTFVVENDEVISKRIIIAHSSKKGYPIPFFTNMESDGTKRLLDYLPALYQIINEEKVYLIDEIERSIHPLTIKEIMSKLSLDEAAKGQLIFTTHESCLLDQEILRPDEIWFAQKDIDGASKLYSLSDFNVHHTANIENGYLNGRYGGIPFLSNLKDLNWHKYEVLEQE